MNTHSTALTISAALLITGAAAFADGRHDYDDHKVRYKQGKNHNIELGPRPFYLVDDMDKSRLQKKLKSCKTGPFYKTDFSIGHRGAGLQFPEHTKESYLAAAQMGAGILECDVTFTKDRELVCRHSQCDLHTTTNILKTDLASKCTVPPEIVDGELMNAADIKCCTSDITLAEFKTLQGKMDAANKNAKTIDDYMHATPDWRTDLYSGKGTLMTHMESIELFKKLGVKMTPELKKPSVEMPFQGDYTQQDYAQQMINEYKQARVKPRHVWAQSFEKDDILYWIENEPRFGRQATYLDDEYSEKRNRDLAYFEGLRAEGIRIIAPPMWMLLDLDGNGKIVASSYAKNARAAGLDIITWTFERTDTRDGTDGDWYYTDIQSAVQKDGDKYKALDVLARQVGILGIFSDWPATVTYYANCMGLK